MEFEDVNEKIEWEARRVAAAFGVVKWDKYDGLMHVFSGRSGNLFVRWTLSQQAEGLISVSTRSGKLPATLVSQLPDGRWGSTVNGGGSDELMAHGLFRLGFEHESILRRLPQISAHEKLELRLSLPREFWPKTWIDEEEGEAV